MAKPYPQELRDRVLAAYDRGMKTRQIATVFQVSPAWTRRLKQRRRETGQTPPRPRGGVTVSGTMHSGNSWSRLYCDCARGQMR